MNIIRWWKSKFFLTILGVALTTIGITFLLAYFIDWGWIPAIAVALGGGFAIRRIVVKRLDELAEKDMD